MGIGHLKCICGPMFSGKSTSLLQDISWLSGPVNKEILVLKPLYDNRYSETEIVSHDGIIVSKIKTLSIHEMPEIPEHIKDIFIDEIQFLQEPHYKGNFIEDILKLLKQGKNITVAGLDADYKGLPFQNTAAMLAMASKVVKLKSACSVCQRPATHTMKKQNIQLENRFTLGSSDTYEARCDEHFEIE